MNKINTLILLIIISIQTSLSQTRKVFIVDDKNDYVMLLDSDIQQKTTTIQNTEIDIYAKSDSLQFHYTLVVSKISDSGFEQGNLIDGKFEDYFKENCDCEVTEIDIVTYNNIKPLRHYITTKKDDNNFKGIHLSFVSGSLLYSVMFLTLEREFEKEKMKLPEIMNSMIINGKTTIEEYSEYEIEND